MHKTYAATQEMLSEHAFLGISFAMDKLFVILRISLPQTQKAIASRITHKHPTSLITKYKLILWDYL